MQDVQQKPYRRNICLATIFLLQKKKISRIKKTVYKTLLYEEVWKKMRINLGAGTGSNDDDDDNNNKRKRSSEVGKLCADSLNDRSLHGKREQNKREAESEKCVYVVKRRKWWFSFTYSVLFLSFIFFSDTFTFSPFFCFALLWMCGVFFPCMYCASIFFVWTEFKTNRKKINEGTRQKRYYTKQCTRTYGCECAHMHMAISKIISIRWRCLWSEEKTLHDNNTKKVRSFLAMEIK